MKIQHSPIEWFNIWKNIIYDKKEVTRLVLSEISGSSLWTIKALQRDFLEYEAYITYKNNKFRLIEFNLTRTLSTLSEIDKEELK